MIKEYSTQDNNNGNSLLHLYLLVVHFVYDINTGTMAWYFLLINEALKFSQILTTWHAQLFHD